MRSLKNNTVSKKPVRGEKEAISLRRRRIMKSVVSVVSASAVCAAIIGSIYLWRSGSVTDWINSSQGNVEQLLVDAGLVVENIEIVGEEFLEEDEIFQTSQITPGEALMSLKIGEIIGRLEELDWVKKASVRRDLSGDVTISIFEHHPAAIWQVENKLWIVSDEGIQITDKSLEYFADLPMISGPGAEKELERLIVATLDAPELFERIETASWVGGRRWDLILKNGIKIMMPEAGVEEAWGNLSEFEQNQQLLSRNILTVDFRIKDKTVVRLTPEEAKRRRLLAKTSGKGEEI